MSSYYFIGPSATGGTAVFPGNASVTGNLLVGGNLLYKDSVANNASNFNVSAAQSGMVFTNQGASGTTTATLPAATGSGNNYTFVCRSVQFFQIQTASSSDTISLAGITSTNQFRTFALGAFFTIVDTSPNLWQSTALGGSWAVN